MLLLKDLPDDAILRRVGERYPDLEASALWPFLFLLKVSGEVETAFHSLLGEHHLMQGRWITLVLLMRSGKPSLTASELAEQAGVTPATMTTFIDGLERKGLVRRKDCRMDRRKTDIYLTPEGQSALDQVMPRYYRAVSRLMKGLSKAERKTLMELLGKVQKGVDRFGEETSG